MVKNKSSTFEIVGNRMSTIKSRHFTGIGGYFTDRNKLLAENRSCFQLDNDSRDALMLSGSYLCS